jgi:hypothetical protein
MASSVTHGLRNEIADDAGGVMAPKSKRKSGNRCVAFDRAIRHARDLKLTHRLRHMAIRPDEMHPESENPMRIQKSKKTHFLLGIIQGHYTITTQDEWVFKTDQLVGDCTIRTQYVLADTVFDTVIPRGCSRMGANKCGKRRKKNVP